MKNKPEMKFIALLILISAVLACSKFGETAENSEVSPQHTESSASPDASPTPRTLSATQLLTYLKANEAETGIMLTDKEIIISGDVWKGGAASFEFWSSEGKIICAGNNFDAAKFGVLEKSVADYLAKRTNKMPFVKAKGIYKKGFSPTAPPNNYWSIVLENCSILEVFP